MVNDAIDGDATPRMSKEDDGIEAFFNALHLQAGAHGTADEFGLWVQIFNEDIFHIRMGIADHDFFHANPGVYFHTAGWIERGTDAGELQQLSVSHQMGMDSQYNDLVEKYGEDNAKYLFDMLCNTTRNYSGIAYIAMGLGSDPTFEEESRRDAAARGWSFTRVQGDMRLFRDLLEGRWDEADFLVVPPGQSIAASHRSDVISITV